MFALREWRWGLAAVVALAVGSMCSESYARLAVPYYQLVTGLIADLYPWRIRDVVVADDPKSHATVLRLTGDVFNHRGDTAPAATVVSRLQVGEVIETPVVFWSIVLLWPAATSRQRLLRLGVGIPIFLGLEAITTGCQLVHSLADTSAILAGDNDPLPPLERWCRFLEAGGRFALELAAALLAVAVAPAVHRATYTGDAAFYRER